MEVIQKIESREWDQVHSEIVCNKAMNDLENGKLIFYPNLGFELLPEEKIFLSEKYSDKKAKNISYDIRKNRLQGAVCSIEEKQILSKMMLRFNQKATSLVSHLLPNYIPHLQIARTSYRPVEIAGRKSSYKKDDTRLHIDAFSSSPNQGKRILRVFSNINPNGQNRVWRIGEPFEQVIERFLPTIKKPVIAGKFLRALRVTKSLRTHYDHIMLQLHNKMKKDMHYQQIVNQTIFCFPPGATWIVKTDQVSHAATSGQFLLEQTFYLPVEGMLDSELSPLRVLEKKLQKKLVYS